MHLFNGTLLPKEWTMFPAGLPTSLATLYMLRGSNFIAHGTQLFLALCSAHKHAASSVFLDGLRV